MSEQSAFTSAERAAVYRAIFARRDIRNYRPEPVPDELLWRVIEAAHHAPSVGFMQPWDFVVIRAEATKRKMYQHFLRVQEGAAQAHEGDRRVKYSSLKLQGLLDAPISLLVTCDRSRGGPNVLGRHTQRHMDEYSTCLAVQNLWLAARAEGLGVGWMSLHEPDFVASLLGLPEDVLPVAYLTMGFPVEFSPAPMLERTGWRERLSVEHLVHAEHWDIKMPRPTQRRREHARAAGGAPEELGSGAPRGGVDATQARWDALTKPVGSLGRLETWVTKLAQVQGRPMPELRAPELILFAADHGVTEEGVSAYRQQATAQMVYQFLSGGAASNVLCRRHGLSLRVVDVGVDHDFGTATGLEQRKVRRGTRNLARGPAMTADELELALAAGRAAVAASNATVLALGEMGIGNTTSASCLLAWLLDLPADVTVGPGSGVVAPGLIRKREVVRRALEHKPPNVDAALVAWGGYEIAALIGAIEQARAERRLVMLDGFIVTVAALAAERRTSGVKGVLLASHLGSEPGHALALEALGLEPGLDLAMRLGEGSGAVLGVSLLADGIALLQEMRTYEEANVERPLDRRDL